mmetsp:Transcript_96956/g.156388  ORF Transcript_96956/g.156388 Transcript_96956/m.156388 type:complete len:244 (+) Transcript_96956:330-1061(+)
MLIWEVERHVHPSRASTGVRSDVHAVHAILVLVLLRNRSLNRFEFVGLDKRNNTPAKPCACHSTSPHTLLRHGHVNERIYFGAAHLIVVFQTHVTRVHQLANSGIITTLEGENSILAALVLCNNVSGTFHRNVTHAPCAKGAVDCCHIHIAQRLFGCAHVRVDRDQSFLATGDALGVLALTEIVIHHRICHQYLGSAIACGHTDSLQTAAIYHKRVALLAHGRYHLIHYSTRHPGILALCRLA